MTIAEAFALAQQFHQAGSLLQAVGIYRQILHAEPAHVPALYCLGAACAALGDFPETVACYRQLSFLEPQRVDVHVRLGVGLFRLGHNAEAVAAYQRALELRPNDAEIHSNLGAAFNAQGLLPQAIACYERALSLSPNCAEAHNNLGVALRDQGRPKEAAACFRRAAQLRPDFAQAHANLGHLLRAQGRLREAASCYHTALRFEPQFLDALANLGMTMVELGQEAEGNSILRETLRLHPTRPEAHNNVGNALRLQGDVDGSVTAYREALRLRPDYPEAHFNLANAFEEQGHPDDAIRHALEAHRLRPGWALPLFALAELAASGHCELPEAQVQRITALAADPSVPPSEASVLHFALGVLRDKAGAYDDAFAAYRQGNDLMHGLLHGNGRAYNPREHNESVDRIIATMTPAFFERVRGCGLDSDLPVFIVGMPRSGTTLVEQILAGHPLAFGAGELKEIAQLVESLPSRLGSPQGYPQCLDRLDQITARTLAQEYCDRLVHWAGPGVKRVVDKQGLNYIHLGLLTALFPRARVIHCRRDPRDVCLSCYFQQFREVNFAWDLRDLGAYYRTYERLMAHWREVLPVQPLEVVYEELVADPEAGIRRIVAYCGLEWDDRCLNFHKSTRPVRTMSKLQVRRPVYTASVERWRRYEKHLGPLLEALDGI